MTGQIEQYLEQEIASLNQQLAEAKKDAERMTDTLRSIAAISNDPSVIRLATIELEAIDQAMREGE